MKIIRKITILATLLGVLFLVPSASAHRPDEGSDEGTTSIPNSTTSYAYYRELETSDPVHIYRFEGEAEQFFHVGVNIPQLDRLEDYGVTLALLGPGLPSLDATNLPFSENVSHQHEDGANHVHSGLKNIVPGSETIISGLNASNIGGIVVESQKTDDFFEPFTQTNYWGRQVLELNLPESGTYYLVVWNPEGVTGKYVLDTGVEEVFGPADLIRFPIWWVNTRLYFEQGPALLGVAMLPVLALIGAIDCRKNRRAERMPRGMEPQELAG
jgi:hypothetical protein